MLLLPRLGRAKLREIVAMQPRLFVRLALPKGGAVYDLSGKFGAPFDEAVELLRTARPHAARLGIAFHVGSQCLEPDGYARAGFRSRAMHLRKRRGVRHVPLKFGEPAGVAMLQRI